MSVNLVNGGGGGGSQTFSVSETSTGLRDSLTLETEAIGREGSVRFNFETRGEIGLSITEAVRGVPETTAYIQVTPDFGPLRDFVRALARGTGLDLRDAVQRAINRSPEFDTNIENLGQLRDLTSVGINTKARIRIPLPGISNIEEGEDPANASETIRFQPVILPDLPVIQEAVSGLRDIPIKVVFKPNETIQDLVGELRGDLPNLTLEVPAEAFVQYESAGNLIDLACLEGARQGDRILDGIEDVRGRVRSLDGDVEDKRGVILRRATSIAEDAGISGDIIDRVRDAIAPFDPREEEDPTIEELLDEDAIENQIFDERGDVSEMDPRDVFSLSGPFADQEMDFGRAEELMTRFNNAFNPFERPRDLIDELRELARDNVSGECLDITLEELDDLDDELRGVFNSVFDETAPDRTPPDDDREIDIPDPLDCSDVSTAIRNAVDQLEEDVRRVQDIDPFEIPRDLRDLEGDADDLMETIRDEVESRNPCKSQLEGRVRTARRRAEGVLDCTGVSDTLVEDVERIKERAESLEGSDPFEVEYSRVENLMREIEATRGRIEDRVGDNECARILEREVRQASSRLEDIRDVDFTDLPCSAQFPEVEQVVSDFEDFANQPSGVLREEGPNAIAERVADAVDTVNREVESDDPETEEACIDFFLNRLQRAENEIERVVDGVRISNDIFSRARERREEILEELRSRMREPGDVTIDIDDILEDL